MKVVIDINDNEYMGIKEYPDNITSYPVTIHLYDAVRNGTPLPKGHGRLIDADEIYLIDENFYVQSDYVEAKLAIASAPTIVPADEEGSE